MTIGEIKSHPEWKLLYESFSDKDYDTFIPHGDIEAILGYDRKKEHSKYYSFVEKWKKEMLTEASRHIECVNGEGYRIVRPDEFRKGASRQMKLGTKRFVKGGKILKNTPVDLLSEEEKNKLGQMSSVFAQLLHFQKATFKKVKEIDKKTDRLLLDVGKALDVAD